MTVQDGTQLRDGAALVGYAARTLQAAPWSAPAPGPTTRCASSSAGVTASAGRRAWVPGTPAAPTTLARRSSDVLKQIEGAVRPAPAKSLRRSSATARIRELAAETPEAAAHSPRASTRPRPSSRDRTSRVTSEDGGEFRASRKL